MKIAVIGAGGVGGAFGAALAKAGADVTFVARGAHLAAMQANAYFDDDDSFNIPVDEEQEGEDRFILAHCKLYQKVAALTLSAL